MLSGRPLAIDTPRAVIYTSRMSFPASRAGVRQVSHNKSRNSSRWKSLVFATCDERVRFIREWSPFPAWFSPVPMKRLRGAEPVDPLSRYSGVYLPALHAAATSVMRSVRRSRRGLLTLTQYGLSEGQARRIATPADLIGCLRGIWLSEHAYEKHARALRRRVLAPRPMLPACTLHRRDPASGRMIVEKIPARPMRRFWHHPAQVTVTKILGFAFPTE